MTRQIVVIRPEPGNAETVGRARALGLDVISMPLQRFEPVDWQLPGGTFDGLLVGSANLFRLGGDQLGQLRNLPVHVVGERTAEVAEEHGFTVASIGKGGLQSVLDAMDKPLRLLRIGGEERVSLSSPPGIQIAEVAAYRLTDCNLDEDQVAVLSRPTCVLLHSASAARNFSRNCNDLAIDREGISIAALGPRISAAAGKGWESVHSASTPDDPALLALAKALCQ